ncbi:MAG: cation transporter [Bacteriovoracia bacterium]
MDDCCHDDDVNKVLIEHKSTLWAVLLINLAMFFVEGISSYFAQSTALLADSLDMLSDAAIYGVTFYAIGKGPIVEAKVSLLKGTMMGVLGVAVLIQALLRFFSTEVPVAETISVVSTLALVANLICALLLLRHRNDNLNMRSVWLCTRNDVLANIGVLCASGLVFWFQSRIPDLVVGVVIALMVIKSATSVVAESRAALK